MTKLENPLPTTTVAASETKRAHRADGAGRPGQASFADQLDALSRTNGITGDHSVSQLLALVAGETNFHEHAHNKTTGATGPFQFIKSTWLQLVKKHGEELGIDPKLVANISNDADGRPMIADAHALKQVLALRNDMALATRMAVKYLDDNKAALSHHLHRAPSENELQISFLLGPSGAARLIKAAHHAPETKAADVVPHAAAANHRLFYDKNGTARSAAEAVAFLAAKYRSDKAKTTAYLAAAGRDPTHHVDA